MKEIMKKLTVWEYIKHVTQNQHMGLYSAWVAVPGKEGQPAIITLNGVEYYYFEHKEIGGKLWDAMMEKHINEYMFFLEDEKEKLNA